MDDILGIAALWVRGPLGQYGTSYRLAFAPGLWPRGRRDSRGIPDVERPDEVPVASHGSRRSPDGLVASPDAGYDKRRMRLRRGRGRCGLAPDGMTGTPLRRAGRVFRAGRGSPGNAGVPPALGFFGVRGKTRTLPGPSANARPACGKTRTAGGPKRSSLRSVRGIGRTRRCCWRSALPGGVHGSRCK